MNLIDRLITKGWQQCRADGAYADTRQVRRGPVLVSHAPDNDDGLAWGLLTSDLSDARHIVPPQRTESALLRSRVGSVTVAAILGEPEPVSVDDVIRERLIAAGWVASSRSKCLTRDGWEVQGNTLYPPANLGGKSMIHNPDPVKFMRAHFGSVTVAQFCGISVDDLEVAP